MKKIIETIRGLLKKAAEGSRTPGRFAWIGAMALIGLLALAPAAKAQVTPVNTGNALSNAVGITATSTNLILGGNAAPIPLRRGFGLGIFPYYCGTASTNTGGLGFQLKISWDGTNYTTTTPLTATSTANGTTAVLDYYYWPWTTLGGAAYAKVGIVTQAVANIGNANNLTITNIMWINDH